MALKVLDEVIQGLRAPAKAPVLRLRTGLMIPRHSFPNMEMLVCQREVWDQSYTIFLISETANKTWYNC